MPRAMLTDLHWNKLSALMQHTGWIYDKPEHRLTLEGILYRMRTRIPWRDLPPEFGHWNSVFQRFNAGSKKGILQLIFKGLSKITDTEWLFIDGTLVRTHPDSAGAASDDDEAIGKSCGGLSTKIHLAVDSGGLPVHFELSGGQVHDSVHAESLVSESPPSEAVIADKGYDSQRFRIFIEQREATPVIPYRKKSRQADPRIDKCLYRYRHLVENAFARIKHFRAIATRYDKLERNYASMVALAFIIVWLPMWVD
ncbi:IS5 family transposase [Xenorhabdus nematophila]|uniref:IS5 family transposase n=1 Tax=Xenorhabdus nematophila TaxID=628 RepID=UPI00054319BF|nr:IS5 family transposase [Xenorhabdus nematophila]CEE94389.1 transposase [Xenorhabdus nematophila str. Anatoliense]CEF32729.1 transposase [Xenorhabdus nematophila str. Websteri]AYA40254.1 IS5 family transposase [Xenorhabdus nematophila]KHD29579.1 transposase [Xenorhabdus nematophila]MBA0018922.1 IS5 family transposase [Xenorhabdus nematophila]